MVTCDWVDEVISEEGEEVEKPVRWLGFSARREMSVRPKNISVSATVAGEVVSGVGKMHIGRCRSRVAMLLWC